MPVAPSSLPYLTLDQLSPLSLPPTTSPYLYSSLPPSSAPSSPSYSGYNLTPPQTPQATFSFPLPFSHPSSFPNEENKPHIRKILPKPLSPPTQPNSHPSYPTYTTSTPAPYPTSYTYSQGTQPSYPRGPPYPAPYHYVQPREAGPSPTHSAQLSYLYEKTLGSVRRWRENGSTIQVRAGAA